MHAVSAVMLLHVKCTPRPHPEAGRGRRVLHPHRQVMLAVVVLALLHASPQANTCIGLW